MRWAVVERLSGTGCHVRQASGQAEAFEWLQSTPDAAIVDASMLSEHHGKFAQALTAYSRGKCVILTSSDPVGELASLDSDLRTAGVLEKPFNLDTLATLVTKAVNLGG